jgi:uncharacterized protein (TIGR03437 family)
MKQVLVATLLHAAILQAQPTDPLVLRHDEAITLDLIEFSSSATCAPQALSGRFDRIAFLNATGTELGAVDIGTQGDAFYLGQGWTVREGTPTANSRSAVQRASFFFAIPSGATSMRVSAAGICAVTMQTAINGTGAGTFSLTANSAVTTFTVTLPASLSQQVTYSVLSGGPVSIASLQWLNQAGALLSTSNTAVTVAGTPQSQAVTRPAGATSFCVNFASAPPASSLRVGINGSSATLLSVTGGVTRACASENDPLERLADRKTLTNGWGEDFNARQAVRVSGSFTTITETGDAIRAQHSGTAIGVLSIELPSLYPLTQFPYLAVRIKADKGSMYFIRPSGLNSQDQAALLWSESAVTDDRLGTGEWETLTFSLPKLVAQAGTGANRISTIQMVMVSQDSQPHAIELDWVRLHAGLVPEVRLVSENNFTNHLDDDGDGLTDRDDPDRGTTGRRQLFGVDHPVTLAFYHVWYGTPNTASKDWLAWAGVNPFGPSRNPNNFVPGSPGQRDLWSRYYPLNTKDFPDYTPPSPLRYDLHGGVELYDALEPAFLDRQIRLAQSFGIEGFLADLGHQEPLRPPTEALVKAVGYVPQPFSVAPLYDFFYTVATDFPEQPNYAKAREMNYLLDLAKSPRWTTFRGKPLITAPFASTLITSPNWVETVALATDPRASAIDGVIDASTAQKGASNQVQFTFSTSGNPSVRFERIVFRDTNLKEIGRFVFGIPEVRALLTSGWGADSAAPLRPGVPATGAQANMQLFIPAGTEYMDIHASSLSTPLNTVAMTINNGPAVDFVAYQLGNVGHFRFSQPSVPLADVSQRPFSFLLDNPAAAALFDGFATYSEYLTGASGGVLVSEDKAVILSVRPGYDDKKIRSPGLLTPRENGAYYRRSWEAALANNPDAVLITSWNEWPEATNIEPTVEFGYQYAELTLTYSMLLRGDLTLSKKASEIDFTVRRREPNRIRLSSGGQAQATFRNLSSLKLASYTVTFNGQPFAGHSVNSAAGTLTLNLGATAGEYVIAFSPAGPQISTITNAATGLEGSLAPGEFFTIKGTGLGPEAFALGFDKGLSSARVFTNGIENFVTYAQAGQLNVVLSNSLPTSGLMEVVVEFNGVRSDPVSVGLAPASPGIFTQDYGPGQAWVFNQNSSVNGPDNRAAKESFVFFYATGPGLTNPVLPDGQHPSGGVFPSPAGEIQVLLNGRPIPQENIVFKSLTFAAVLQINFKLPADAPTGAAVQLKVSAGGLVSRDGVTMAIQ